MDLILVGTIAVAILFVAIAMIWTFTVHRNADNSQKGNLRNFHSSPEDSRIMEKAFADVHDTMAALSQAAVDDPKNLNIIATDLEMAVEMIPMEGTDDILGREFFKLWAQVLRLLSQSLSTGKDASGKSLDSEGIFKTLLEIHKTSKLHGQWALKRGQVSLMLRASGIIFEVYKHQHPAAAALNQVFPASHK